jgi:hypothetical protein
MIQEYNGLIESAVSRLKQIGEEESSVKPAPNKWSSKEILGHLVDSSINNMSRLIKGQFRPVLVFSGYDQISWVKAQNYQNESWEFIVDLWKMNNLQLIHVVNSIPNNVLIRTFNEHNFDVISWKEVPKNEPVNLKYLVTDYFDHMKHHLNQIFKMNSIEEIE